MKLKPGIYIVESMQDPSSTACAVVGIEPYAIPVDAGEEDIRFRLEILYPERSFKDTIRLTGDKANWPIRAALTKEMIKRALAEQSKPGFLSCLDQLYSFWIRSKASAEGSFGLQVMMESGCKYKAHRGTTQFTDSLTAFPDSQKIGEAGKRISDQMFRNGFNAWRNMHKNALRANSDVPERDLHNKIVSDPLTAVPYVWTKEDAEEVASLVTPDHWAFQ